MRNTTLLLLFSILFLPQINGQEIIKPNIVFIYADDLGWQDTQLNDVGDVVPWETPNMLALAEDGANFSQVYASAPSCAPSRGGTMSGRMPLKTKMTHVAGGQIPKVKLSNKTIESYYPGRLQLDEVTIAEALNPLGYVSGHVGKWHMAANHNIYPEAVDQGFDYQDTDRGITRSMGDRSVDFATDAVDDPYRLDADGRPYDAVTELALDFMDDNKEEPFFLYMAHWLVHSPIQTRDLALLEYYCDKLGIPVPTTDANITTPGQTNPYYGAMIASLDWSLGRVVDYLKETDDPRNPGMKLFDTTYIIFASDNGGAENHGSEIITDNFPLDLGKTHTKEGGLRTPFVITGPGIVENQVYDNMVSHLDFYPTIMEVTGADAVLDANVLNNLDGVSLFPFLSGTEAEIKNSDDTERTDLFWHYPHGQDERASSAIRSGNYKLYKIYDNGDYYKAYQLYNDDGSDSDIEEMVDVIDTMPVSLKNEMILKLETLLAENDTRIPHFNPDYNGDPLVNQDIVPSVTSTVYDHDTDVATATLTTNPGDAIIETAYLLYRIEAVDSSEEEWFELPATINGNVITADVPEVATGIVFTLIDENNFVVITDDISTVIDPIDGTYTNAVDLGDETWDTATNWTNSIIANETGIATLERTIDLETNSYTVGQLQMTGNSNTKTFSNGTLILNGTTSLNPDQIIRNRSNKAITITCNVTVDVDDKEIHIRENATTQLIFNTGTFALGSNTINVDNKSTATTTTIPVEFNGAVTGDSSSRINIINQDVSLGASSDFSGFTGSITFGGTNGLLTVNGVNTIEGSIGVLAASDGNSIIEFNASQNGLANLSVDTQALALDFDAAATAVEFAGYTTSTTEGVVDLQNYVSGSLRIGTNATTISQTILNTWLIDGVEPADGTLVQDASGYINVRTSVQNIITFLQAAPNGEWQTTTNWDTGALPLTTDQALILYAGDLTLDQDRTIGNLKFQTNTARSFLDAGSTILTLDTQFASNSRLIDNSTSKAITIYPSINFTTSGIIYNRNKTGNQLTFTGGTIYINSNTITTDSRSTNSSNQYIVFNGPVDGDGIINVDDSQAGGATQGISLGADADFSTFTGTINAKNNPIVSSTTNAFGSALTLDGTASFEINVASTFTGSISRLATTAGAATVTFNANQSMGALTVDTQPLAIDFDAAATAVEFSGYTTSTTEGVVDLQNYTSGILRIGIDNTGISQTILDTWLIDGLEPADGTLAQDASGFIIFPTTFTSTNGQSLSWEDGSSWAGGIAPTDPTENVIIHGLITINSDVTVNNITIVNADGASTLEERVVVGPGHSLTVEGNAVTRDQIFASSNSTSYGSLIFKGVVDGQIRLQRFVNGVANGNDLIASPVTETFAFFAGDSPNLLENPSNTTEKAFGPFDNTTGAFVNWDTVNDGGTNIVPGQGYRAASSSGDFVTFRAEPESPAVDVPVSITDGGDATYGLWNLIGNPFPSYLDFGAFWTENSGVLNGGGGVYQAIYGYDADDSDGSNYTIWNGFNTTDKITPGQGFFVRTISGGTVTFKPGMRTVGSSDDFIAGRSSTNGFVLSELFLSNGSSTYNTKIYFAEDKTKGLDPGYDAADFTGATNGIYTDLVEDNEGVKFAIQALPYNDFNDVVVPLGVNSDAGIQLTIGLDATTGTIPSNINVYLEDNVANTWTLLNSSDYVFTPSASINGTGRFYVHYSSTTLTIKDDLLNGLNIYTEQSSKTVVVKGKLTNDTTAVIYDVQGRKVLQQELDSAHTTNTINVNALTTGIYIVQLENNSQVRTQKVILN